MLSRIAIVAGIVALLGRLFIGAQIAGGIVAETSQAREPMAARFDFDTWVLGEYFKAKRSL